MRCIPALAITALLAACGSSEAPVTGNDAERIKQQIDTQAQEIRNQTDANATAIEQALENEGAAMFDNRAALLNESGNAAAASGNRSR